MLAEFLGEWYDANYDVTRTDVILERESQEKYTYILWYYNEEKGELHDVNTVMRASLNREWKAKSR